MKFKFYYAKHKITDEFVSVEYSSDDEGMIYTRLGLSHWESDTPYFSTPEEITRLVNGHMNDHWCVILSDSLKAAINSNEMKIAEIGTMSSLWWCFVWLISIPLICLTFTFVMRLL